MHGAARSGRASGKPTSFPARRGASGSFRAARARGRRTRGAHAQPRRHQSRLEPAPRLGPVRARARALRRRTPARSRRHARRARRRVAPVPAERAIHRHRPEVARRVRRGHALVRRCPDRHGGDHRSRARVRLAVPRAGGGHEAARSPGRLDARLGGARAEWSRCLPGPFSALELVGVGDRADDDPGSARQRRRSIRSHTRARSPSRSPLQSRGASAMRSSTRCFAANCGGWPTGSRCQARSVRGHGPYDDGMELTPRKLEILRRVVEEYVATGQPVGSRALVERSGLDVSPSTVRSELFELEAFGLLTHPHTSAGRVRPRAAIASTPRTSSAPSRAARPRSRST